MKPSDTGFTRENFKLLIDGKLPWEEVKKAIRLSPKDADRFQKYIEILQEKVPWKDRILLRISDHLYIVAKPARGRGITRGDRIVKCDCGQEFGDYRINWKLSCRVYVRATDEAIAEVITIPEARHNTDLVEMREFYCPGCYALLGVEVVPPGYPPIFEMFPDLDSFYREWIGTPLEDEHPDWFQERTSEKPRAWVKEA
jgi:acetone carboxylase gamma subunit